MLIILSTDITKTIELWSHWGVQKEPPHISFASDPSLHAPSTGPFLTFEVTRVTTEVISLNGRSPFSFANDLVYDHRRISRTIFAFLDPPKNWENARAAFKAILVLPSLPTVSLIQKVITNLVDSESTYCSRLLLVTTFNSCPLPSPSFKRDWVPYSTIATRDQTCMDPFNLAIATNCVFAQTQYEFLYVFDVPFKILQ